MDSPRRSISFRAGARLALALATAAGCVGENVTGADDSARRQPLPDPFRVIAHRGASAYAPENTLPAFLRAVEVGASEVELDVQLSRVWTISVKGWRIFSPSCLAKICKSAR